MNNQYVWIAIVIVGIVGGIEIGYAVSNAHNPYMMHGHFHGYDGWSQHAGWGGMYGGMHDGMHGYDGYHNSGYMMQDSNFRQQMYSGMFGNSQYRQEMSEYLAQNPRVMYDWCNTMMNNPQHLQLMQKIMGNFSISGKGGMGMMNYNSTKGTYGMGNMGNMGNMMHP